MKNLLKLLFIAIVMCGCQNIYNQQHEISNEVLDTIQTSQEKVLSSPDYFETAFSKGATKKIGDNINHFLGIKIGKLKITSGKVIVSDPLHIDEYGIPFTSTFPTGEFPVELSVLQENGNESIAFARIKFSDKPVVKWEKALQEQRPVVFGSENDQDLYCVDGGTAIFLDKDAAALVISKKIAEGTDSALFEEMYKHNHRGWRYAMYDLDNYNLAAFTTGKGDGCFHSYIGYDDNGKPCRLLTDFGLVSAK